MAKARINLSTIKSVVNSAASSMKQFLWDSEVRGFGVYKNSAGVPTFVYQYRFNGGTAQRVTLGTLGELTVEAARTLASTLAHQVRTGTDPIAKRRADLAAADAETGLGVAGYFDSYLERRRTGSDPMSRSQENVFRRDLVAHLGALRLDRLTVADVDGFKAELYDRGPSMVRSGLVCLRTIINDAINRGALVRTAAHAFEVPATVKRERRIDEWEACRLLEAARDLGGPRGDILEILIRLGKRKEEVAELSWEELDMQKRQWRLPSDRNKSKKPHLILLPDQVYDIIARQQPDATKRKGPVFTINGTASGRCRVAEASSVRTRKPAEMQSACFPGHTDGLHKHPENKTPNSGNPVLCPRSGPEDGVGSGSGSERGGKQSEGQIDDDTARLRVKGGDKPGHRTAGALPAGAE